MASGYTSEWVESLSPDDRQSLNNGEYACRLMEKAANACTGARDFSVSKEPIILNGLMRFFRFDVLSHSRKIYFPYVVPVSNFYGLLREQDYSHLEEAMSIAIQNYGKWFEGKDDEEES